MFDEGGTRSPRVGEGSQVPNNPAQVQLDCKPVRLGMAGFKT
jgi:hypothetical protein